VNDQPPKPRRGCFFYGCITSVVLLAIVLGALLVGLHYVKKMVNRFTDNKPMELPTLQMSKAEIDQVKQRFESFEQEVSGQRATKPLVLTADDINALIASSSDPQALKGKLYVSIEGDQVKGEVSVPLQEVGLSMFKGRYLNGSATFNLGFREGALIVTPSTLIVKGSPVPEAYMQEIRKQNFAASLTNELASAAMLHGLQEIQVKEGKVVIVPKLQQ
jgi:hypothetical protein